VAENLTLGAYSERAREHEDLTLDRVHTLFPKLRERGRQIVRTMSGGEQQMVAIGRAMMSNPSILTLDEPSLGLSPLLSKELFQNLAKVRELGIGVLMVEQNAKQSLAIADRCYLIENARVVHEGTAADMIRDPAVQTAYLGAGSSTPPAAQPEPEPLGAPEAATFAIKPRSRQTLSADTILGRSVADLVASASRQSRDETAQQRPNATATAQVPTDRLAATMAEIERAAQKARNRPRTAAPARTTPVVSATPAPQRRDDTPPPVIEVYRAPRVEVYRRQPGGSEFERS